jgi:hypothetical protein
MRKVLPFLALLAFLPIQPAYGQSPNNSTIVVLVTDQSGATVPGAQVSIVNGEISLARDATTGNDGAITVPALPLTGAYSVTVSKSGFETQTAQNVALRAGETATVRVRLTASGGTSNVTVYGTTEGVRADPQKGERLESRTIDETPILGRKVTTLPLFDSSFRQGKGTGDLFVNATYFVTGGGSRRTVTYVLDGASIDEGWGRQTAITTVPIGAVQEVSVLSNSFSAEYGWTAGPALNIVSKSGTNDVHGELLYMNRPEGAQASTFATDGFCPPSVPSCVTPSTLTAINPADVPDVLQQYSGTIGAPLVKDKTFFFASGDYTRQNRTVFLSPTLPSYVLPADGSLTYVGNYRQGLLNSRVDHKMSTTQTLMARVNFDRFYDTNPNDAVGGTNAPTVARRYTRGAVGVNGTHTWVVSPTMLNEARVGFNNGAPVTLWEAQTLSTAYTRAGTAPFTIGQSRVADMNSRQLQISDTLSWSRGKHYLRLGGALARHNSGGTGSEPGTAVLGTFTFLNTTTAPPDQLTLKDVQNYQQPIDFGIDSYSLTQWLTSVFVQDTYRASNDLTLDLGLRYDNQSLSDARKDFAPRIGFGWHPGGDARTSVRGGYGMYYTQLITNVVAGYLVNGLDGLTTYTATPGQFGFPTCLTGPCLPVPIDPKTLPPSQLPARDITIRAGMADFYRSQFAKYGLNFDQLPYYPDKLVNPRSQTVSIGAEREIGRGLFVSADYLKQHWTDLQRTIDLNAPSVFDRTAPGQTRSVAAANLTRPILPVNGGVRQVNVLTNLGAADYDGLTTELQYRGHSKIYASVSYTLSKATNTSEPDGNGIAPNQSILSRLGEDERGPSLLDQRHRAVITFTYLMPYNITAGTVSQFASARPFNSTTGIDNNGDGANNDRPVINGTVVGKSAFLGTGTQDVAVFVEGRLKIATSKSVLLRAEVFNLFNHANILGRAQTIYGDAATPNPTFGQVVAAGTASNALPALANIDPPRMLQLQARFMF